MAIEQAIEILDPYRDYMADSEDEDEAAEMAIEALKCQQWIPCSERLPDLPKSDWCQRTVIVCAKGHVRPLIYEREIVRGKTVERWKWMWDRIYDDPDSITHWMPLPEPPKEV